MFGTVDKIPQLVSLRVDGQLAFALFLTDPTDSVDRVAVDDLVEVMFFEISQAMDNSQELTYIISTQGTFEMEDLCARSHINALILHDARVTATSRVDSKAIEDRRVERTGTHLGHTIGIDKHIRHGDGRLDRHRRLIRLVEGRAGLVERIESLVAGSRHTFYLTCTFGPRMIDTGMDTSPDDIIFLFDFTHKEKKRRNGHSEDCSRSR